MVKGKWWGFVILCMAISMFSFCFTGKTLFAVKQEKSLPYELTISAGSNTELNDSNINKIGEIPYVTAVTPLIAFPAILKIGKKEEQATLTGINANYVDETFIQGAIFPNTSAMPYIMVNDVFQKQFYNIDEDTDAIDLVNSSISIQLSETDRPTQAKIHGIFSDEQVKEPTLFVSLSVAKEMLRKSGQNAAYTEARVRVTNIDDTENVVKSVEALGFTVTNMDEETQMLWESKLKEVNYLLIIGLFSLFQASAWIVACKRLFLLEQKKILAMFQWLGMKRRDLNSLFLIQTLTLVSVGIAIGLFVCFSLPLFLPKEYGGIFLQKVPFEIVMISVMIGLFIAILSSIRTVKGA